jgi:purine-nucleoside phosphorylase
VSRLSLDGARVAVVLGSGGAAFAERVTGARRTPFGQLPGFAHPTVAGHAGELVVGRVGGVRVAVLSGRVHAYEGYSLASVVRPVRAMARAGIRAIVVTNASGAIRRAWRPGDLMIVADHLNAIGDPLAGGKPEERFTDLGGAYDPAFRRLARASARRLRIPVREGVYAAVRGPSFETPAEIRMWRRLGADAIGMSTAPEVILLRQSGVRVLAVSLIANMAAGISPGPLDHRAILVEGEKAARRLGDFLEDVLPRLDRLVRQ